MRRKVHMLKTIAIHFLMLSLLPGTLAAQDSNIGPGWKERILTAVGGALVMSFRRLFNKGAAAAQCAAEFNNQHFVSRLSTLQLIGAAARDTIDFSIDISSTAATGSDSTWDRQEPGFFTTVNPGTFLPP